MRVDLLAGQSLYATYYSSLELVHNTSVRTPFATIPKPQTPNPHSETRNPKPETWNLEPGIRIPELDPLLLTPPLVQHLVQPCTQTLEPQPPNRTLIPTP